MASLMSEIKIIQEYRPCFVKGQKALFHRWVEQVERHRNTYGSLYFMPVVLGIIESEDGHIGQYYPHEIVFCDGLINQYGFKEESNNAN